MQTLLILNFSDPVIDGLINLFHRGKKNQTYVSKSFTIS